MNITFNTEKQIFTIPPKEDLSESAFARVEPSFELVQTDFELMLTLTQINPELAQIKKIREMVHKLENFSRENRSVIKDLQQYRITPKSGEFLRKHIVRICKLSERLGITAPDQPTAENLILRRQRCLEIAAETASEGLDSFDSLVKIGALELFGDLVKRGERLDIDILVQQMRDPDPYVRLAVLRLAKILAEENIFDLELFRPILQTALQDPCAKVCQSAFWLWGVLLKDGLELLTPEKDFILQVLINKDPAIQQEIFNLIQILAKQGAHLDLFVELMQLESDQGGLSNKVAALWVSLVTNKQIFDWLHGHLDPDLRSLLPPLLTKKIDCSLSNANESSTKVGILTHYLLEQESRTRKIAERALCKFFDREDGIKSERGRKEATEVLLKKLNKWLESNRPELYAPIWKLLVILAGEGRCSNIVKVYLPHGLKDSRPEIRTSALRLLIVVMSQGKQELIPQNVLDLLVYSLGNEDDDIAQMAVQIFRSSVRPDTVRGIFNFAKDLVRSENFLQRRDGLELFRCLVEHNYYTEEAFKIALSLIEGDPEGEVRLMALKTLRGSFKKMADLIDDNLCETIVINLMKNTESEFRLNGLELITELVMGSNHHNTAERVLIGYLNEEFPQLSPRSQEQLLKLAEALLRQEAQEYRSLVNRVAQKLKNSPLRDVNLLAKGLLVSTFAPKKG